MFPLFLIALATYVALVIAANTLRDLPLSGAGVLERLIYFPLEVGFAAFGPVLPILLVATPLFLLLWFSL